jgi:glycosyltransferase involved in cell wall biosynthesis
VKSLPTKYSVIIPTKNSMPYLKFAVESALGHTRADFELIVSVNHSTDSTLSFLRGICDSRLRIVEPPSSLSMSEHWDFAQSHAKGEWQMFLGGDDLLMSGFMEFLDHSVQQALLTNSSVIVARRAYVTWAKAVSKGLVPLQYWGTSTSKLVRTKDFIAEALTNEISYHAGPQMYTSCIVHKNLLDSIREHNSGNLISGHPQDAYLCAVIAKNSDTFLSIGLPFSYVGTSEKSAGRAVTHSLGSGELLATAKAYEQNVQNTRFYPYKSDLKFNHGIDARYLYDALIDIWPNLLKTKPFDSRLFKLRMEMHFLTQVSWAKLTNLGAKHLLISPRFLIPKFIAGKLVKLLRRVRLELQQILSLAIGPILRRNLKFHQVQETTNDQNLFDLAMALNAAPKS